MDSSSSFFNYSSSTVTAGTANAISTSSSLSSAMDNTTINNNDVHVHRNNDHLQDNGLFESLQSEKYMSVFWHSGLLGVAYYDSGTSQLHLMLDIPETVNFTILKRVCQEVEPVSIVVSSKQDEKFLKVIQPLDTNEVTDMPVVNQTGRVHILPSIDFALESCKRRLVSMNLPTIPDHLTDVERSIYISSIVPFEHEKVIRAAGALLKFLEKQRVGVELEDASVKVPIVSLNIFSLKDTLFLEENTYSALQIFQKESHPSAYKSGGSGAKEGLSLFGILNKTKSVIGSNLMRIWFMRPSRDINLLRQRQEAVAFFMSPRNIEVVSSLQDCLKHIKNVPRILSKMKQAQASIGDWQALYKTAYNAVYIGDICRSQPAELEIFRKIASDFTEDLHSIANLISRIVDFDESVAQNRFTVKEDVDPELDHKKRTFNSLPSLMTQVAREELNSLSSDIEECNVIYLPQLGYLLTIPRKPEMVNLADFEMQGFQFMFMSNDRVHYKSAGTNALDEKLGDTQCVITDHETQIMHRLQNSILERSAVLLKVMDFAAEIDWSLNFFFMAHIGSFVPAEGAHITLLDGIYSRVQTKESVSVGLSTFMIDLNQMSQCVRNATAKSLVIVDEFGKGTETGDGVSLLCACLRHWLDQEQHCPHVLVSTHFHCIFQQHLLPDSQQLMYQMMDVIQNEEEMIFLFQLKEGCVGHSHANQIAKSAGLPQELIQRGLQVTNLIAENKPIERADTANTKNQFKRCEMIVKEFLTLDLDKDSLTDFLLDFVLPTANNIV
ncbi:mutS protein homolog 5-like [Anneissia japonica]|uniref:mutS protein homolog 5-like n=1 Tax=Anneissia japonica TaxID=1529436 RepID=UPI00142562AC|nr:mutS protein homolog 5-like [Anneissia japonica]